MKVYVDELPKSCEKCEFRDTKHGRCDISGARVDYFGCHALTPLSYYTKQVRKEVCEEIKEKLKKSKLELKIIGKDGYEYTGNFLDHIQGENN